MNLTKVISTRLNDLGQRLVKVLRMGRSDVQEALSVSPYGIDSNPIKGMVAVYAQTGVKGETVIVGYIAKGLATPSQQAEPGEVRLFSTDSDGAEQIYHWIKNDGTMEFGGDAKNLARYQELETAFNELQARWNEFAAAYVPGSPTTTGLPATANQSTSDISGAKIDELKCL